MASAMLARRREYPIRAAVKPQSVMQAESKGAFFNERIRDRFSSEGALRLSSR